MWAVQVAFVMNHPLFMSLDNFKLSINWNETAGFVRLIDPFDSLLSSQKRNCQCLPRNGRDSCFEKWIYGMIGLACTICSPVCPEGSHHLVNPFTQERWNKRQFQKLNHQKLISIGESLLLYIGCMLNQYLEAFPCKRKGIRWELWIFIAGLWLIFGILSSQDLSCSCAFGLSK